MGFTFYGDLLGISGYYKLSPRIAKEKLNQFYNTLFSSLSGYCNANADVRVHMFSDSLLFYGDNPTSALEQLHLVYVKLLHEGLLLRGGMVGDKLKFQVRTTGLALIAGYLCSFRKAFYLEAKPKSRFIWNHIISSLVNEKRR